MKKVIQFFLFNFNIELCCSYCLYKNLHKEHNVLEITNEKLLNKEYINLEITKEFDQVEQKSIELKSNIENEINKINNLYEKIIDELTK